MRRQPIWGVSVVGGVTCGLLALTWLFQGQVQASGMMALGSLALFGWAAWLADHDDEG
jgi:hypothetical protein